MENASIAGVRRQQAFSIEAAKPLDKQICEKQMKTKTLWSVKDKNTTMKMDEDKMKDFQNSQKPWKPERQHKTQRWSPE